MFFFMVTSKRRFTWSNPPEFVAQGKSGRVYRLIKALYGLKQSHRAWFRKLSDAVIKFRMRRCEAGHSIFSHLSDKGRVILIVYADDIIITRDDCTGIEELKTFLQT